MSFDVIKKFEESIAEFFGAPYAVAVDCCTHAIELCLRYEHVGHINVPKHTYLSVPFLANKIGIGLSWRDEDWHDYYQVWESAEDPSKKIIDAAVLWRRGSYIPGTYMCVSFQFRKHLSLGRGGIILLDNEAAAYELKKMSYDGRLPDVLWRDQNINTMGYHYYMTPETAQKGLDKLPAAIETEPTKWTIADWPDLTQMDVFKTITNSEHIKEQLEEMKKDIAHFNSNMKEAFHDPVYTNLFEAEFSNNTDLNLLNENVLSFEFVDGLFGTEPSLYVVFNLNVAGDKIQPLSVIKDYYEHNADTDRKMFDITFRLLSRSRVVIMEQKFKGCWIHSMSNVMKFDYSNENLMQLGVTIKYTK